VHEPALGLTLFLEPFGMVVRDDDQRPSKHADTPFGDLSTGDLDIHQSLVAVELGVAYRLGHWRLPGANGRTVWFEPLLGGRLLQYDGNVDFNLFKVRFVSSI
jgi:hypothetical protein